MNAERTGSVCEACGAVVPEGRGMRVDGFLFCGRCAAQRSWTPSRRTCLTTAVVCMVLAVFGVVGTAQTSIVHDQIASATAAVVAGLGAVTAAALASAFRRP